MTPAIEALRFVAHELDPLYRPARFLLGYSHLARGDVASAETVFEQLTQYDVAAIGQAVSELRPLWINRPPMLGVAARIPVIRRWVEYWKANVGYVTGGTLVIAAQAWDEIKAAEASGREADANFLRAITQRFGADETIRAAMQPKDSPERERARRLLDRWLNETEINRFDADLTMLSATTLTRQFVDEDQDRGHANFARRMAELRRTLLGELFDTRLEAIEAAERDRRWQTVRDLIDELKKHTVSASDYHVVRLLDDRSVDSLGATLAVPFVPALRGLRARRRALQHSLYTESVYHLALAELISDQPAKLKRARRRARELREHRLPGRPGSGPLADLWLLTMCLEINCDARLLAAHGADDDTDAARGADLEDRWRPVDAWYDVYSWRADLERALRGRSRPRAVRAALHTALGLADRIERLHEASQERRARAWDFRRYTLYTEATHFREALNLYETAATHCYAAQALLDMGAQDREVRRYAFTDARGHVERALALSPLDPLARRLSADERLRKTPTTAASAT